MGTNGGGLAAIACHSRAAEGDTFRENQNGRGENVGCQIISRSS